MPDQFNLNLLRTDKSSCMRKAANTLKQLYPGMFHVTCLSHFLHNCAMHIGAAFPVVNKLISSIKAATVKNPECRIMYSEIEAPPKPVVTR